MWHSGFCLRLVGLNSYAEDESLTLALLPCQHVDRFSVLCRFYDEIFEFRIFGEGGQIPQYISLDGSREKRSNGFASRKSERLSICTYGNVRIYLMCPKAFGETCLPPHFWVPLQLWRVGNDSDWDYKEIHGSD